MERGQRHDRYTDCHQIFETREPALQSPLIPLSPPPLSLPPSFSEVGFMSPFPSFSSRALSPDSRPPARSFSSIWEHGWGVGIPSLPPVLQAAFILSASGFAVGLYYVPISFSFSPSSPPHTLYISLSLSFSFSFLHLPLFLFNTSRNNYISTI